MYLWKQPVEQLQCFCRVLQGDIGNAFHQIVAKDILVAISPDPWKCVLDLLFTIAKQLSQSASDCDVSYLGLKQTMNQCKNFLQPRMFLIHLLFATEEIASVTDVTAVRGEILRVYQSLDW